MTTFIMKASLHSFLGHHPKDALRKRDAANPEQGTGATAAISCQVRESDRKTSTAYLSEVELENLNLKKECRMVVTQGGGWGNGRCCSRVQTCNS